MPGPAYGGGVASAAGLALVIGTNTQAWSARLDADAAAATTIVKPGLTAAGEAANARAVTIQAKDLAGASVARVQRFVCEVLGGDGILALVGAWTVAATTGTEVTTTAKPTLVVDSTAAGTAVVSVADVTTVFVGTVYLLVTPLGGGGVPEIIALSYT